MNLKIKWLAASSLPIIAIIIVAFILFGPTGNYASLSVNSSGVTNSMSGTTNLVSQLSPGLIFWLAFIIAMASLASMGILQGKRSWVLTSGIALLLFSIISGFSIGLFVLPLAILVLIIAAMVKSSLPQDEGWRR